MAFLGRLTVQSSMVNVQDPCKVCNLLWRYCLDLKLLEVRFLFKTTWHLSRLQNISVCQSKFDQAFEIKHDGRHEGLDTDLG